MSLFGEADLEPGASRHDSEQILRRHKTVGWIGAKPLHQLPQLITQFPGST